LPPGFLADCCIIPFNVRRKVEVGGVDGKNILFPSAQLCRVVLPDAVIGQLLAVIIETQPHPVGGCEKGLGDGIAAHHLGTEPDACRQRRREAVLLGEEQGFLLHGHARVHLAEDRQILAAVAEDAPLNGVLPIRYDELTVTETDLRLICHILKRKSLNQAVARLFGATFHTSPGGDGPLLGANSPYSGCNAPDLLF